MIVCTVARFGSKMAKTGGGFSVPIWTGAIYERKPRKRDGKLTWRRIGSFGGTRSGHKPSDRFVAELKAAAEHPWMDDVRHGDSALPDAPEQDWRPGHLTADDAA